jgi:hypothetical protein
LASLSPEDQRTVWAQAVEESDGQGRAHPHPRREKGWGAAARGEEKGERYVGGYNSKKLESCDATPVSLRRMKLLLEFHLSSKGLEMKQVATIHLVVLALLHTSAVFAQSTIRFQNHYIGESASDFLKD